MTKTTNKFHVYTELYNLGNKETSHCLHTHMLIAHSEFLFPKMTKAEYGKTFQMGKKKLYNKSRSVDFNFAKCEMSVECFVYAFQKFRFFVV